MSLNDGDAVPDKAVPDKAMPDHAVPDPAATGANGTDRAAAPGAPHSPGTGGAGSPPEAPGGKQKINWFKEVRAIALLILAVLVFHSLIAKPFYIPSESMMPGLLKGDRLVVSKYPYGWSWVSPSFHIFPRSDSRLFGSLPERGDVVIVTPPNDSIDYIKRVIGLPGDTIQVVGGQLMLNGNPVPRERRADMLVPIDDNVECLPHPLFGDHRVTGDDGVSYCRLPIYRETLPNGAIYDTVDLGYLPQADDFGPYTVPDDHVFLMGDNRDESADSRFAANATDKGLGGAVSWSNIGGRAEFITFSLDGSSQYWNPISWFTALRGGRAGSSLRPDSAQ